MPIYATIEQQQASDSARGATRVRMRLEAAGMFGHGLGAVTIHNLSKTGMLIETPSDLSIGQRIAVSLPEAPDCVATIVWRSEALAGCRFDQPLSRAALSAAQLRNPLPKEFDPERLPTSNEMLSERLLRIRQERGLSRTALSERTGLSKPSIWAWENGKTTPRRSNIAILADALGISVRELLVGEVSAPDADEVEPMKPAATTTQVRALIQSSREAIAVLADVDPGNVRITIEF